MSLNKIIIAFIVILLLVSAYFAYTLKNTSVPKSTATINNHTFYVQVASTSAQQQLGLSSRPSLPQDQGMIFVFKTSQPYPFWMKDMEFPLDIIFINNNKIVQIFNNLPKPKSGNENPPIYTPSSPANLVLEVNAGTAKSDGFKTGDNVKVTISQ